MNKKNFMYLIDDIFKVIIIVTVFNILSYTIDSKGELFDYDTLKIILYITIALIFYHFFIRKLIFDKLLKK